MSTASTPITSIEILKRKHSLLLRSNAEKPLAAELIMTFIRDGCDLGAHLASEDARESAQGILDYWTGNLLSREPARAPELGLMILAEYVDGGTPVDSVSEEELKARAFESLRLQADKFKDSITDAERKAARIVLLNLFKLVPGSRTPITVPLMEGSPLLQQPDNAAVVQKMLQMGLIRKEGTATAEGYVMADNRLLMEWEMLREIAEIRRGFRDMASGWEKGGKQAAALLNRGSQLETANDYSDLSDLEKEFMLRSRNFSEKVRKYYMIGTTVLSLILLGLVFWLWMALDAQREASKNLEEKILELQLKQSELEAANETANARFEALNEYQSKYKSLSESIENLPLPEAAKNLFKANNKSKTVSRDKERRGTVEIFVSLEDAAHVEMAQSFVETLEQVKFSVPNPLARKNVAATTEVRYFHSGDKALANQVRELLLKSGFPASILEPIYLPDDTAPKKFIQVSVAKGALSSFGK